MSSVVVGPNRLRGQTSCVTARAILCRRLLRLRLAGRQRRRGARRLAPPSPSVERVAHNRARPCLRLTDTYRRLGVGPSRPFRDPSPVDMAPDHCLALVLSLISRRCGQARVPMAAISAMFTSTATAATLPMCAIGQAIVATTTSAALRTEQRPASTQNMRSAAPRSARMVGDGRFRRLAGGARGVGEARPYPGVLR